MATLTANLNTWTTEAAPDSSPAGWAWFDETNAKLLDGNLASNDIYIDTAGGIFSPQVSYYLKGLDLSSKVPAGATINGITVTVHQRVIITNGRACNIRDVHMELVKAGTVQTAADKADTATNWPLDAGQGGAGPGDKSYGGVSDLWSNTWTAAEVNASDFGVVLSIRHAGIDLSESIPELDQIDMTITYTPAATRVVDLFPMMMG